MKNRKVIVILLSGILLITAVATATGLYDTVLSKGKAFIYCKGKK